jgi:hypothetical protein
VGQAEQVKSFTSEAKDREEGGRLDQIEKTTRVDLHLPTRFTRTAL